MRIRLLTSLCAGGAAATLLLSACVDQPLAPRTAAIPAQPSIAAASRPARLIPNQLHYRDSGHQPATGRSGSAQLSLRAMLDVNGVTIVEMTTGTFDTATVAPGQIAQVQLKAFEPNGSLLFARRDTVFLQAHVFRFLRGLGVGFGVQVQANVRGIDGTRTDVVTVRDSVVYAPDLAVLTLKLPLGAQPGMPVPIFALVHERMGSMGARADCVLYVDGAPVDRARGIWVDRNGSATCSFVHVFPKLRSYNVAVRVENVGPSEYDPSNNERSEVLELRNAFAFAASFVTFTATSWTRSVGDWLTRDGTSGSHWVYESGDSTRYQLAQLSGSMPRVVAFPIPRVRIAQRSGSFVVEDENFALPANFTYADADSAYACANLNRGATWFWLCSGTRSGSPATWLGYGRTGGDVIYYSSTMTSGWYPGATYDYYEWSTWPGDVFGPFSPSMGSTYDFVVALDDGATVWTLNPQVPLQPFGNVFDGPPSCTAQDLPGSPPSHFSYCSESHFRQAGFWGLIEGLPDPGTLTP